MRALWLVAVGLLTACVATKPSDPDDPVVASAVDRSPVPEAFAVCHGYGCLHSRFVAMRPSEWAEVRGLFLPASNNAQEERDRVRLAIGRIERSVGALIGTSADKPRTPRAYDDPSQLDCVDEAINTSTYLHLLARQELLRWHQVGDPASRYAFLAFGVHFTAVLVERATGRAFAVDSWFHANGEPAEIVELAHWRAGWEPTGPPR